MLVDEGTLSNALVSALHAIHIDPLIVLVPLKIHTVLRSLVRDQLL